MKQWIMDTVSSWEKILAGLAVILGTVGGGLLWFDGRYALLGDFRSHAEAEERDAAGTRALVYQGRQSQLEEQKFRLEVASEARKLTTLERERLASLRIELGQMKRMIDRLEQKSIPR